MASASSKTTKAAIPVAQRPVSDVPTLGNVSAGKLEAAGIGNLAALATSNPMAIKGICDNDLATGRRWIEWARAQLVEGGFMRKSTMTASELLKLERAAKVIPLGTPALDKFLSGGLRGRSVYEVYGKAHNGKTQLCFQACCAALQEAGGKVVYLDTENTFDASRVTEIAEARGQDAASVRDRIEVVSSLTTGELALQIEALQGRVDAEKIRLIICDSFNWHARKEMTGREFLSARSQWMMKNVGVLKSIAIVYSIPVLITSEVTTDMSVMFGDNIISWGGTGYAHAVTYRIKIHVPENSRKRVFIMKDSPSDPQIEQLLHIGKGGFQEEDPGKT